MRKHFGMVAVGTLLLTCSCGTSLFKPLSKNDSDEAILQDAINALDSEDYSKAAAKLKGLWSKKKDNNIAQLYSIALLGKGGFILFNIIENALKLSGTSSSSGSSSSSSSQGAGGTDIMNQLATNSSALLGGEVTPERQAYARQALDVLTAARDQSATGLVFQKCLTAAIYSVPIFNAVTAFQTKLNAIQTRTQTLGASVYCGADNSTEISQTSTELTDLITESGSLTTQVQDASEILDGCIPKQQGESVNSVTTQVQAILTTADKGCSFEVGQTQTIGQVQLPQCLNSSVAGTTSDAAAGDGKISGCELFLHCGGGGCLSSN